MTKAQNPEEVATKRVEILSPLLYREMDRAQRLSLIHIFQYIIHIAKLVRFALSFP